MSRITKRTVYAYNGTDYLSLARAKEAWENDVNFMVRHQLAAGGEFSPAMQHKLTASLLNFKDRVIHLLSLELPTDESDED